MVVADHSCNETDVGESGRESAGVDVNLRLEGREIILGYVSVTGREMRAVAMNEHELFGGGFDGAEVHSVDYRTTT